MGSQPSMTKRFRLAVVAALLAAAFPVWVQAQESEHRRAAETWKKKKYGQFKSPMLNKIWDAVDEAVIAI